MDPVRTSPCLGAPAGLPPRDSHRQWPRPSIWTFRGCWQPCPRSSNKECGGQRPGPLGEVTVVRGRHPAESWRLRHAPCPRPAASIGANGAESLCSQWPGTALSLLFLFPQFPFLSSEAGSPEEASQIETNTMETKKPT